MSDHEPQGHHDHLTSHRLRHVTASGDVSLVKYGPKGKLSPTIDDLCPLCGSALKEGDYTTLIRTTRTSRHGNHQVEVHWDCATRVNG